MSFPFTTDIGSIHLLYCSSTGLVAHVRDCAYGVPARKYERKRELGRPRRRRKANIKMSRKDIVRQEVTVIGVDGCHGGSSTETNPVGKLALFKYMSCFSNRV